MGYRTYIAEMPKREYNKIKSMTDEQLIAHYNIENEFDYEDETWHRGPYEYGKNLYEFGKYTEFEPPKKSMLSFFKKQVLKEKYKEYDFFIVTPEFLEYVINHYSEKVEKYYNDMIEPFFNKDENKYREKPKDFLNSVKRDYSVSEDKDNYTFDFEKITSEEQTAFFKIIEHVRSFRNEWNDYRPFNLKNGDHASNSCKYEYAVFELVRIYKSFDWKKKVMIYYGY